MPKVNVINAWRMWHGGSKRCGENGREKVRPFKNIPEEDLLVISKKVRTSWRVWKCVMDHLCDKLDDLKAKGIYDWRGSDGNKSPLTPDTIMYLARVIPAAPQKPGKSKRTVVASMNTVGRLRFAKTCRERIKYNSSHCTTKYCKLAPDYLCVGTSFFTLRVAEGQVLCVCPLLLFPL